MAKYMCIIQTKVDLILKLVYSCKTDFNQVCLQYFNIADVFMRIISLQY